MQIEDKTGNNMTFLYDNYHQTDSKSLDLISQSAVIYDIYKAEGKI
jgi:hypothetical protein